MILLCTVKAKFALTGCVTLVLERDGSVIDPDYEMIHELSTMKETLMVLAAGEVWCSSASAEVEHLMIIFLKFFSCCLIC